MIPAELRREFPLEPGLVFLNHGSFGARPRAVLETQEAWRREAEATPVEFLGRRSGDLIGAALEKLGAYVGSAGADLAFLPNATTGVSVAAASVRLGPGDEVLGSAHEYGACAMAWKRAALAAGATWRQIEVPLPWRGDDDYMDRLKAMLSPRTRVLFLSHITSATALRFPVEKAVAFARERGITTVIDGAHAPGQIELDLEGLDADYYIANCHKWLCAPLGSGFIRVRRELHAGLEPLVTSWGLVAELAGECGHEPYAGRTALARRLQWLGTRDLSAFLSVPAAIEWSLVHDGPEEKARSSRLASKTAEEAARLLGMDPVLQEASHLRMALVPLPSCEGSAVKAELYDRFHIEVPVTSHAGRNYLRLSIHCYNGEEDREALLGALMELEALTRK